MGIVELMIIAIGVSMDALAVSICKGLSIKKISPKYMYRTAIWFGGFQALMPLIGYLVGIHFADFVTNVDHWIAFVLLALIGSNMIKESFSKEEVEANPDFSFKTMFSMAVATSIDALAVGVSFAFLKVDIWSAILVIGVTTAAFSAAGVLVGNVFGARYKSKAELAGGVILIAMGLKILLTHIIG
jgi:putative Mn2+ efflux pump MntP